MPRSRLMVREIGDTKFVTHNGDYPTEQEAHAEGTRLCTQGGCEAFEVWTLHSAFEREFTMRPMGDTTDAALAE